MYNNVTNLLPLNRRKALSRDFTIRITVVAVVLVTIITLVAAVLLIPTYVLLQASANAKATHLANMESTLSSGDETALSARLAALSSNAAKLAALSNAPSVSAIVRSVLAISRAGITLSNFSYTPAANKSPAVLAISGSAATRDALRSYQLTLQNSPLISSATLPVSAYASDTNITFTITIILAP